MRKASDRAFVVGAQSPIKDLAASRTQSDSGNIALLKQTLNAADAAGSGATATKSH
jgi:hypothetical protein